MVGLILKALVGVLLFVGSLLGGLAATGRLTHDGTANIPLLRSFFPPPPPTEGDQGKGDKNAKGGKGTTTEAAHGKAVSGAPADANAAPAGETGKPMAADAGHGEPGQEPGTGGQEPQDPPVQRSGRSVVNPEKPAEAAGGHGGDHGNEAKGDHGEKKAGDHGAAGSSDHGAKDPHAEPAAADAAHQDPHGSPDGDFQQLDKSLAHTSSQYRPGALFRFDGMPANLTPEQINEAWQRVQGLMAEIERRRTALDLREKELQEQHHDVSRRQADLGLLQARLDEMQRAIDAKILKFQDQVKLVRNDEVAALKRNAQTLAAFEPVRAAEIVQEQWKTEKGQDEVLRLLEFMEKDAVNEILKTLPMPLAQDVMNKRLRVSKEPAAPAKGK